MMERRIRITKRFNFEMAHALHHHDGKCANIHGHSYVLDVTLIGAPRNEHGHPKDGMVVDFGELKGWVHEAVIKHYDHFLLLQESDRATLSPHQIGVEGPFGRTRITPWQPSCENVLLDIVERLQAALPDKGMLYGVRLQETATSWCEWGGR